MALTANSEKTNKPRETRGLLITGAACATGAVAEEGLEGGPFSSVKEPLFHQGGAKSGAVPDDLLWVIEAWPNLESKVREAVVALVKTSFKGPKNDSSGKSSHY